MHIKILGPLKF